MKQLRLDALVRVSRRGGREGESFRSPQQQREVIERWVSANDAKVVQWYESIDVSGKTMKRADVAAALERIREGQTDGVIIAWLNRLSRAPVREALTVLDEVKSAGGRVVAVDMAGIDPNDATGEMALTMMLAVNRLQWRQTAERFEQTRADAIRAGIPASRPPFGYTRGENRRLVVVPDQADVVRELFERKASGATWRELTNWINQAAPRSDGEPPWHRNTLKSMLSSRTYLGHAYHGKHENTNAHEAIVSPALWRKAQGAPGRRTPRGTYLLSGLARCSGCGRTLRGSTLGRYAHTEQQEAKRVYTCQNQGCTLRTTIFVEKLNEEVVRQFFARLEAFHLVTVDDDAMDEARNEVVRLTSEVERLAQIVPSHPAAVKAHQEALTAAEQKLIQAEDLLHEMTSTLHSGGPPNARELRADWSSLTLDEQREIIRSGIDAVLVRRASRRGPGLPTSERVLVLFAGEAPAELLDRLSPNLRWTWDDDVASLRSGS